MNTVRGGQIESENIPGNKRVQPLNRCTDQASAQSS